MTYLQDIFEDMSDNALAIGLEFAEEVDKDVREKLDSTPETRHDWLLAQMILGLHKDETERRAESERPLTGGPKEKMLARVHAMGWRIL